MTTETYTVSAAGKVSIKKDPNAVLDYTFDWTEWLNLHTPADNIVTGSGGIVITPQSGLTVQSSSHNGKKVIVWLAGGVAGTTYSLACRIITDGGRTDERTVYIQVKER